MINQPLLPFPASPRWWFAYGQPLQRLPLKTIGDGLSVSGVRLALDNHTRYAMEPTVDRIQLLRAQLATETAKLEHLLRLIGRDNVIQVMRHD
jgi:hypothetical protein